MQKTIWLFREQLTNALILKALFHDFDVQLQFKGLIACRGQIINVSFVEDPKQRNIRKENEIIKEGEVPESFKDNPNKLRQKDLDACWAQKHDETLWL